MGELMGYVDQITSYGFSSTDLGNKASFYVTYLGLVSIMLIIECGKSHQEGAVHGQAIESHAYLKENLRVYIECCV